MDKFEQMVETIEEAEDMVECKECFDLFPKAECTKIDHGYICPTCGREQQPQDFSDVSFTDITTDLYDQEFPDVMDYDSEFKNQVDERRPDYDIDTMVDILVKDEFDAIDSYELADEVIQHATGDEEIKDDLLDTIEHIKEEEEEHIDELNKAAGRVEEDPEDKEDEKAESEEDSDSDDEKEEKDEDKDEDEDDDKSEDEKDSDDEKTKESLTEASLSDIADAVNADFETVWNEDDLLDTAGINDDFREVDGGEVPLTAEQKRAIEDDKYFKAKKARIRRERAKDQAMAEDIPFPEMVEGEEILEEKKEESVFDKIWKPVNESLWVCKFKDQEIGTVEADTEEEAIEKMQAEYPEYNYGEYDGCFEVYQEATKEQDAEILNEANFFTGENKHLNTLFTGGYLIKVRDEDEEHTASTYKDAEKLAIKASKAFPDGAVDLYGIADPDTYDTLGTAEKKLLAAKGKPTVLAVYRKGKAQNVDKASAITKAIKNIAKYNKAVGKSSKASAAAAEEAEAEARAGQIDSEAPKDAKVEPASDTITPEPQSDKEETVVADNTIIEEESYELIDKLFVNGYVYAVSKETKLFKIDPVCETAIAKLKTKSNASTENQGRTYFLVAKAVKPDTFENNGKSIISEINSCWKGLALPSELEDYKGKLYVLAAFNKGKRIQVKGNDLLERIQTKSEMFNTLLSNEDIDSEEDDLTSNSQDQETKSKEELEAARNAALERLTVLKVEADGYTSESYAKYEKTYTELENMIKAETSVKKLETKFTTEKMTNALNKVLKAAPQTSDSSDTAPAVDSDSESAVEDTSSSTETAKASSVSAQDIAKALRTAGMPLSKKQNRAIRKLFGESLTEEAEETVECVWCNNIFPKGECRREVDMGWLCDRCERAINSRGETLTFEEDFKTTSDAMTELKDTVSSLEGAISGISNMADAMKG